MEEHALLIIQDQPKNEQWEHPLSEDVVEIGRDPGCGLTLPDRQVSRHHATIYRRGGQYMLRDEGSRNGTLLNGQMMRLPYALHDGDEIRLAARYRLIFVASEATAPLYRPGPTREGLYIDQAAHRIWIEGIEIAPPLSPAQYSLLELLYKQDGAICTRDEVVSAVWSEQEEAGGITDQAIDALVRRLRQRIKDSGSDHEYIETVRGHGFRLNQA